MAMFTGIHAKKIAEARLAWTNGPALIKAKPGYSADEFLKACGTWSDDYAVELLEAAEAGKDTIDQYAARHGAP